MVFNYERKGVLDAPEIFLFQDLLDSPRSLRELGKVLEPHFHVFYIYLPDFPHWTNPLALSHFAKEAESGIHSLWEESDETKLGIAGGMSWAFWREMLGNREKDFRKFYIFQPEWNELGKIGTFLEVLKTYWDKPGFHLWDWIRAQPIAHHLSLAQTKEKPRPPYPLHFLVTDKSRQKYIYETKHLLIHFPGAEWSRFPSESPESLKFSKTIKKFLLMNLAKDYDNKNISVMQDIIKM